MTKKKDQSKKKKKYRKLKNKKVERILDNFK